MSVKFAISFVFSLSLYMLIQGSNVSAQIPTTCFQIESILVDACGNLEGENEMVRMQIGPNPIAVANLQVTWPNNSFLGFCSDTAKLQALNNTILHCGFLLAPPGGIIPAGKQVLIITSTNVLVGVNSFANLTDTLYVLFQCAGNTFGHFANYSTGGNLFRTLIIKNTATGCSDTATYNKTLLINQSGQHSSTNGDGATVNFDWAGNATYVNNGCNIPIVQNSVHAGNDTTYKFCTVLPTLILHGSEAGNIFGVHWKGGSGTFSQRDSLTTSYTPSALDVFPLKFYFVGKIACNDSIIDSISISLTPPVATSQSKSICSGSGYHIGTHTYTTAGTFTDTIISSTGCDSIVTTTLSLISAVSQPLPLSSCHPIVYKGQTYSSNTSFLDTLRGIAGCDSVHLTVTITISGVLTAAQSKSICNGGSYHIGTHTYTTAGIYKDTLLTAGGCDSVVTTTIAVQPITTQIIPLSNCGHVVYKSISYFANTTLLDTIRSVAGCDSVRLTVNITIVNALTTSQSANICSGHSIIVGSHTYSIPNTYHDTVPSANGCDSIIITTLTIISPTSQPLVVSGCLQVVYKGIIHTTTTTFNDTLRGAAGCDSIYLTVSVIIKNPTSTTLNPHICQGANFVVGSHSYASTGSYRDTLFAANTAGCDSFIQTNLTVDTPIHQTNTISGCNQVTYNANTYSVSTTINQTIKNIRGCDSIIKAIQIIVNTASYYTQNPVICAGQHVIVGTHNYGTTGTFKDTLHTAAVNGCDSIVFTNLNVITPYLNDLIINADCNASYKGKTYSSSAIVQDTIKSQITTCDSVYLTVTITITPLAVITSNKGVCIYLGQFYFAGGQNQTTPGVYRDTVHTAGGCDSIYTITDLHVVTTQHRGTHIDSCYRATVSGSTYTRDTVIPISVIPTIYGCDSIVIDDSLHIYNPIITIASSDTLPIPSGSSTVLFIRPSGIYQNILWSPNQSISNIHDAAPTVSPMLTTSYAVSAVDSYHCRVNASIVVRVTDANLPDFIMPTAFSPNDDMKNDLFKVILRGGLGQVLIFHVYNRWGELIYDKNIDNPDGWDGKYKGVSQPIEVYAYYVSVKGASGKITNAQGNVTLLR